MENLDLKQGIANQVSCSSCLSGEALGDGPARARPVDDPEMAQSWTR